MGIHCAAAERDGLMKKKERKKESSWVKLKALRVTSGGLKISVSLLYSLNLQLSNICAIYYHVCLKKCM